MLTVPHVLRITEYSNKSRLWETFVTFCDCQSTFYFVAFVCSATSSDEINTLHGKQNEKGIPSSWCPTALSRFSTAVVQLESIKTSEKYSESGWILQYAICLHDKFPYCLCPCFFCFPSGWVPRWNWKSFHKISFDFIMYHLSFIWIYHLSYACCTVVLRCAPGGWDRYHQHQRRYSRGTHQFVKSSRCQRPGICRNLRMCLCSRQLVVWSFKCWDSERNNVCAIATCFDSD